MAGRNFKVLIDMAKDMMGKGGSRGASSGRGYSQAPGAGSSTSKDEAMRAAKEVGKYAYEQFKKRKR